MPAHLKEGVGDLAKAAHAHGVHQHLEHMAVLDDRLLQALELALLFFLPGAGQLQLVIDRVSVHDGNTSDSTTFMPQVTLLREQFGIEPMVMVGDRGMISQKAIDEMSEDADLAWVTALRSASIRTLVEQQYLQLGPFDERNLLEISSPAAPKMAPGMRRPSK